MRKRKPTAKKIINHDKTLLGLIAILLIFGVVMVHNATVIYSQDLFGGAYRFVFLQVAWIIVGMAGFSIFYFMDQSRIKKLSFLIFILSIIPLFILAFFGLLTKAGIIPCDANTLFSPCLNGAHRWIYLNPPPLPEIPFLGVLGFQASEFAKLGLILYLARLLEKNIKQKDSPFMVFMGTSLLVSTLIILQPNMSTAILVFLIASVMYFASGASLKPLIMTMPVLGVVGFVGMITSSYRRARLLTLFGGGEGQELTLGYHIRQILIALGSGGMFGLGFGQSRQKFQYLPEVSSDSIFAIIGEELGFVGTTAVVGLFLIFIYKGLNIAKNSPDLFGRLVAVGVTSWIGLQFFVNIAAMTRIIPLTGVPIPLISYGGSSMLFSLMALGVLGNVSRNS